MPFLEFKETPPVAGDGGRAGLSNPAVAFAATHML